MSGRPSWASGVISIDACGSERPPITSSSSTESNAAESELPSGIVGSRRCTWSPSGPPASDDSRARIQLTLPSRVLNSPLWALIRNGCASAQLGKVLVEKRECTMASALAIRESSRSA